VGIKLSKYFCSPLAQAVVILHVYTYYMLLHTNCLCSGYDVLLHTNCLCSGYDVVLHTNYLCSEYDVLLHTNCCFYLCLCIAYIYIFCQISDWKTRSDTCNSPSCHTAILILPYHHHLFLISGITGCAFVKKFV